VQDLRERLQSIHAAKQIIGHLPVNQLSDDHVSRIAAYVMSDLPVCGGIDLRLEIVGKALHEQRRQVDLMVRDRSDEAIELLRNDTYLNKRLGIRLVEILQNHNEQLGREHCARW